ncbi:hypothetical protein [Desulfobacula sp.]
MSIKNNIRPVVKIIAIAALVFLISGCTGDWMSKKPEQGQPPDIQPTSPKTTAVYYDFEDILIPMELKIVDKRTVVISSPGFTSGILTLKGRLEKRSLFDFFSNNMQKDAWNILSQIKAPAAIIMVFQKASRTAVITIRDEQLYTYVEVGVAPMLTGEVIPLEPILVE